MPYDGIEKIDHDKMLTEEELLMACRAASTLGINKIRLTGGEPLVKKNIISIIKNIKNLENIEEVCLTTNGILLNEMSKDLLDAGIDRINFSLDTLNKDKYKFITRIGNLDETLNGLKTALNVGFKKIKINTVLIGGFNDDEIEDLANLTLEYPVDVRFIELMPMYDSGDFKSEAFISSDIVLKKLQNLIPLENDGSVARLFKYENSLGNIGIISPITNHFCKECNRIRLTADGNIKPCLHSKDEILIKNLSYDEMIEKFKQAIMLKPEKHEELSAIERTHSLRNMNRIGG